MNPNFCKRCGADVDWDKLWENGPEDVTIYWVPHCPECNAKQTTNTISPTWFDVSRRTLKKAEGEEFEEHLERVHAEARFLHGKMVDVDVDGLVKRAKHLDSRAFHNRFSRNSNHNVTFNLRKQAREMS